MQRNGYGWEGRTISFKRIIWLVAFLCFFTQAHGQSYTPVINLLFINTGGAFRALGDSLYFVQADGDTAWILDLNDIPTNGQVLTSDGNKVAVWATGLTGGVDFADSVTHDGRKVVGDSLITDDEALALYVLLSALPDSVGIIVADTVGWKDDGTVVRLVTAGDSVGIGTSIPQSEIDVQSDTAATLTLATKQTAVLDGAQIGRIDFNAPLESSGSNSIIVGASIWGEADIAFSATNNNTEIVFATAETGAVAERMRLTADGNLGIGATSPSQLLEVAGTSAVAHLNASQSAGLWIDRGAATRDAQIKFLTAESPNWYLGLPDSDVSGDGSEFYIGTSAQGASPALWIETNGNLGIANNNPATKLHVVGSITLGDSTTGDVDAILYFADDGSVTAESFMWNDGNSQFELSDDIDVTGNVVVSGTVDGKDIATNAAMLNEAEAITADWDNTANPWAVNEGGTGAASLTDGGILLGSGTGAITALGEAANGQIPIGDGTTDPVLATITGTANEVTVTNGAGSITLSHPMTPHDHRDLAAAGWLATAANGPEETTKAYIPTWNFDTATAESLTVDFLLPSYFSIIDSLVLEVGSETPGDDSVRYQFAWVGRAFDEDLITAFSSPIAGTINLGASADQRKRIAISGSFTSLAAGDRFIGKLWRDPSVTGDVAADVYLISTTFYGKGIK